MNWTTRSKNQTLLEATRRRPDLLAADTVDELHLQPDSSSLRNLGQWITSGIGGVEDVRDRPQEFADHGAIEKDELLDRLDEAAGNAKAALENAPAADLLEVRRVQGFDVSGIGAIFDSVSHFRGHSQEIVHLTRIQLGDRYEFYFVPTGPEQGAGAE